MELRSFLPSKTSFVALTATATSDTIEFVVSNLNMNNPVKFIEIPEKDNIKFILIKVKLESPHEIFSVLVKELEVCKYETKRCIIF